MLLVIGATLIFRKVNDYLGAGVDQRLCLSLSSADLVHYTVLTVLDFNKILKKDGISSPGTDVVDQASKIL